MRVVVPLFKASVVAALVFGISWIRFPQFVPSLRTAGGVVMAFGIPIVIMGILFGFPLAVVMSKCGIMRWWSTTSVGAVVGALLGFVFSYGAWHGAELGEVANPFWVTFSPVHWQAPGFTNGITFTLADLVVSILLTAMTGAALSLSFWFFHTRAAR